MKSFELLCSGLKTPALSVQRGLSLIELLVALALSLIIVAALSELYVNLSRSGQEMAKTNAQIENARFALGFLQNDIVHAGYWGGYVPQFDDLTSISAPADEPTIVPDPCLPFGSWSGTPGYINSLIGIPVQVHNAVPGTCNTAPNDIIPDRVAGTDILVVRHANTCVPGDANCEPDIAGNLYFQVSNCEDEITAGFPYALDTDASQLIRYERDCAGFSAGSPPTFTAGTVAAKRKFVQNIYYIRDYANTAGDGIPTLVRSRFDFEPGAGAAQQPAEELVQGIEAFRVELGIDNVGDLPGDPNDPKGVNYDQAVIWDDPDNLKSPINRGDGIPDDNFFHCGAAPPDTICDAAILTDVVAVKLWVLARTDETSSGYIDTKDYSVGTNPVVSFAPFNDSFKRHVFSTTVRVNNVAGRRETPL